MKVARVRSSQHVCSGGVVRVPKLMPTSGVRRAFGLVRTEGARPAAAFEVGLQVRSFWSLLLPESCKRVRSTWVPR